MLFQGLLMLELLTISSMIPVWIQQVIASYEQDQKYLDMYGFNRSLLPMNKTKNTWTSLQKNGKSLYQPLNFWGWTT